MIGIQAVQVFQHRRETGCRFSSEKWMLHYQSADWFFPDALRAGFCRRIRQQVFLR